MTKPLPKCPDCGKKFHSEKLIAMHRARAHGYVGTAPSTVAARERRARLKAEAAQAAVTVVETSADPLPVNHACPECGAGFASAQLMGRHRVKEHGVLSVGEQKKLARQNMQDGLPCPHCDFVAVNKAGYSLHVNNKHADQPKQEGVTLEHSAQASRAIVRTNGSGQPSNEGQAHPDGISEATLALALGRFQGLCQGMAIEFDLPPRRFAREFIRLIYATQVR